jgi:deoxycytidylate deaminase
MYLPITSRDKRFIDVAYTSSFDSNMLRKHGCCVVENNTVIGTGCNVNRTQFKDDFIGTSCSCHAEMTALRRALKTKIRKLPDVISTKGVWFQQECDSLYR